MKNFNFSRLSWEFKKTWQVFWGSSSQYSQVPSPELCQHYLSIPNKSLLTCFTYVWLPLQVRSKIIFVKLSFWAKSVWNSIRQSLESMLITSSDIAFVITKIILLKSQNNPFHTGYNFVEIVLMRNEHCFRPGYFAKEAMTSTSMVIQFCNISMAVWTK